MKPERTFTLSALLSLLLACSLPGAAANQVENPSLEEPGPPFGWQPMKTPWVKVKKGEEGGNFISRRDGKIARTGKYSWFLFNDTPDGRNYIRFKQMKCHYGVPFEFRIFTKITMKENYSYIWYDVTFYGADKKLTGYFNGPNMDIRTNRWNEQVIRFYPPEKTAACSIHLKFCGPMAVYLDDASFGEVPHSAYVKTMGGKLAESPDFTLWSESPMCQVRYEGLPEKLPGAKKIDLAAAGNETESFQLVLTPKKAGGGFSWEFPPLKCGGTSLSPDAFSCRQVDFIKVTKAKDPRQLGMIADPLTEAPAKWPLAEKRNTAFFVTVKVPAGTPRGVYTGEILLKQSGKTAAKIPVSLKVWGFGIPQQSRLSTFFYTSLHMGNYAYTRFDKRPHAEIMEDIHSLKREMRISANQAMSIPAPEWKLVDGKVRITNWEPFDKAVEEMRKKYNFNFVKIPLLKMLGDNAGWFKSPGRKTMTRWKRLVGAEPPATPFGGYYDTPEGIRYVADYSKQFLEHMKAKFPGVRPFWYIYDELPFDNIYSFGEVVKNLKREVPGLPLFVVGGPNTNRLSGLEICCTSFNPCSVYSPGNNSKEHWYYQWANSINPASVMNARAFAWQIRQARGSGGLLWFTVFCGSRKKGFFNPWEDPTAVYESMYCTIFYPPKDGKGKCVPSQRAWLIRDGIEDFDLLKIAEERLGKEEVQRLIAPWITDPFDWRNDPAVLEKVRRALGDAIDAKR